MVDFVSNLSQNLCEDPLVVEKKWISEAVTFIDAEILDLWRNVLGSVFIRRGMDLDVDFWVRLGETFLGLSQI